MSVKKFKKPRNGHKQYNPDTEQYEEQDDRSRKYYNRLLFTKAMKVTNSNPYEAKRLYEEYLDQYPTDCLAWTLYASILITLKEFDLASMILDRAENMINQYKRKGDGFQEQHADEKNLLFGRIRIMSFRGQYKKLLDFLEENPIVEEKYHLDEVKLLCKKKLGICFTQRDDYTYLSRQIIKYEVQDMMHRVEYHGADYNAVTNRQENVFAAGFPLQKVIDELQKDQKEKAKKYETESTTLDYLRPEKESRPKYINISNQVRGPPSRNYQIKMVKEKKVVSDTDKSNEKGDNRMDDRSNRAFMRFRRNQEQKKDDSGSIHKSLKVSKIAKDLEETLNKRKEKEKEEEEGNDENQNEDEK